jgi:uncharacterized repeat protein (TIGR01451 family)
VTPPQADLEISKTVNEPRPSVTDDDFFTITVTNHGPDTATNVAVTDPLPDGLVYASTGSSATQGTFDGAAGTWAVGTLASGASATLTSPRDRDGGQQDYTNTATVTADQYDPNANNNQVRLALDSSRGHRRGQARRQPDAQCRHAGHLHRHRVERRARRRDAAGHPGRPADQLTFVSALPSVGDYDSTTGDWTIGDLANGASVTLAITAKVVDSGTIDNTAAVHNPAPARLQPRQRPRHGRDQGAPGGRPQPDQDRQRRHARQGLTGHVRRDDRQQRPGRDIRRPRRRPAARGADLRLERAERRYLRPNHGRLGHRRHGQRRRSKPSP